VTGNAIINSQGQGDNPVCSTRDEISQPSRPIHHEPRPLPSKLQKRESNPALLAFLTWNIPLEY